MNNNLSPRQKYILEDAGTELPGSGQLLHVDKTGVYHCAKCDTPLFLSSSKYDSSTPGLIGWPSFDQAIQDSVEFREDKSLGQLRTEVICKQCGGHLGHVFAANDSSTGQHFCINSAGLCFEGQDGERIDG
ncbi:peptide-methionine (R)-S-oxide reductase MsrB [Candidatus Saccharibacteria bacterium]|nr:peptide-methionine (R)-S-oxide reductase MsrB [Candidatus Saccharibacteria bacterium]MCB9821168.1 peptide-methionine (R)-S-oxide reductase MsrB [Candidatus Nomurabacteria bacterium]